MKELVLVNYEFLFKYVGELHFSKNKNNNNLF